jgi:hypothetical protein
MAQILALDEAWSKVDPAQIKAAGYVGVLVYLSRDVSKCATAAYIAACHAVGLGVAFVFEDSAQRALGGAAAGLADGQYANAQADGLGVPADLPLYAAVDFDVTPAQMPTVVAYVRAFGSVRRPGRGYGSTALVDALVAAGIPHDWQTCAWSGSTVNSRAAIYQRLKPTTGLAGSFDEDVILDAADAGFWFPTPTPVPQPVPVPAPAPSPVPAVSPAVTPSRKADPQMGIRTLLVTRSDGAVFAVREDLSEKAYVVDPTELGALAATGDYVEVPRGKFSDAEINAIPDAV